MKKKLQLRNIIETQGKVQPPKMHIKRERNKYDNVIFTNVKGKMKDKEK